MKTFKLTRKFLGGPALNTVITEKELEKYLQSATMEEILEYWTEMPEKGYLIVTVICSKSGKRYIYNSTHDIYVNENFQGSRRGFPAYLVEEFVKKGFYTVESVKLKDSPKVFKVGDSVTVDTNKSWKNCFIKAFVLSADSNMLVTIEQEGTTGTYTLTDKFRVLKSIKTADNKEVYEGDNLWFIFTDNWTFKKFDWRGQPTTDPRFIWLSSEEAVKEVILLNKPVSMSFADVMACTTHTSENFRKNLLNLVTSKA